MRGRSSAQRGYALTWAVMTLVIAALLAAFILPVGLAFSRRNAHSYSTEQAYLTARSAAAAIAANSTTLVGEQHNKFEIKYKPAVLLPENGDPIVVSEVEFEAGYRLGEITSARIVCVSEELQRVTVRAEYAGASCTVSAYLGRRAEKLELTELPLTEEGEVDKAALVKGVDYQFYEKVDGKEDVLITSITTYTWEITGYTRDGGMTDETPEE